MHLASVATIALTALMATTPVVGPGTHSHAVDGYSDTRTYTYAQLADTTTTLAGLDDPTKDNWNDVAPSATRVTGREGWFGKPWAKDVNDNGCDTRNDVLARDLSSTKTGYDGCTVQAGTLIDDPYTGRDISFTRGATSSAAVQIDHVIPLNYAFVHGAERWTQDERETFANDELVTIAVDGDANQEKSDSLVATAARSDKPGWWPTNNNYRCAYSARIVLVGAKYGLGLASADATALHDTLTTCAKDYYSVSLSAQQVASAPASRLADDVIAGKDGSAHQQSTDPVRHPIDTVRKIVSHATDDVWGIWKTVLLVILGAVFMMLVIDDSLR